MDRVQACSPRRRLTAGPLSSRRSFESIARVRRLLRTACGTAGLCLLFCGVGVAQNAIKPNSFEVASIKPSPPDDGSFRIGVVGNPQAGGRWTSRNVTLAQIIRGAYPGHPLPNQVVGGPDWVRTTQFDISAKAPSANATRDELVAMARNLLAERFKLALRTETRETSGYALVLERPGTHPALRASALDCESVRAARVRGDAVAPASASACVVSVGQNGLLWRLVAGGIELTRLAELLSPRAGAPVVDATGLKGQFDITLEFSTDPTAAPGADPVSVFTALKEQLGLRLERRRVPMEVLVVDRVEPPTAD